MDKDRKVLLVATESFLNQWPTPGEREGRIQIYHVSDIHKVFPILFDHKPDTIVIDYDFLNGETEKLIRRIRTNSFYDKLKICCFKRNSNHKVDEFLKAIGVNYIVYKNDFNRKSHDHLQMEFTYQTAHAVSV